YPLVTGVQTCALPILLGKIEQQGIIGVDQAYRRGESDKVLALREHELRAAVGLFPFLGQRIELRFYRVGCRWQEYVTRLPTLRRSEERRVGKEVGCTA